MSRQDRDAEVVLDRERADYEDERELRDWWKVVPWLETRLAPLLEKHLSRYD